MQSLIPCLVSVTIAVLSVSAPVPAVVGIVISGGNLLSGLIFCGVFSHSKSNNLKDLCLSSDIIIAAIGKPNFVKQEWVKENAVIIDVGINVIEDKNGLRKIVGDVDYEDVIKKVSFISPVPGGVGPMTIHCLLSNTFLLTKN